MTLRAPLQPTALSLDAGFPLLKAHLIEHTGLSYYSDKDEALAQRLALRLEKAGLHDCAAYLELLRNGAAGETESDALIAELTIGETYFFRHREQLDALRLTVIPELIRRNTSTRRLRIWSAGCASGEEPYSLSILLKDAFRRELEDWDVSILGTDINRDFLGRAREGKYGEWAFRTNSEEFKRGCFRPSGKSWLLAPEYREGVTFQYHNLANHPFPSLVQNIAAFDLIVCRNVMIYFSTEGFNKIVPRFSDCLVEKGWLLLGHSEVVTLSPSPFTVVAANGVYLYRRGDALPEEAPASPPAPPFAAAPVLPSVWRPHEFPPEPKPMPPEASEAERPGLADVRRLTDQGRWEQAAQACAALLGEDKLSAPAYFYQAMILEQLGEMARAEDALRKALYLDRSNLLAHYHLGLFLLRKGDEQEAKRSFRNVLRLLEKQGAAGVLPGADGLTASDLMDMTNMELEVLET